MTGRAWPIDAVPAETGDPLYAARHARQTSIAPFLFGAKAGRALGARSGVRAGTPAATVEVTSTTWTVHQVAGAMDVEAPTEAGPYGFAFDADETGAMRAAHMTYTRWDGLYVQLDDPAEDDSEAPATRIVYAYGPEQASPALPSGASIPRSFRLCKIVVPQAGGGSPTVVWDPPFLAEGIVPVTSTDELTALAAYATPECPVFASMAGQMLVGNGTTWVPVNATDWYVRMERTSNANIANGALTPLTVWEVEDAAGLTTSGGVVTVPVAGRYRVAWGVAFPANGTGSRTASILKNGTTATEQVATNLHWGNAALPTVLASSRTLRLAAGDTLRLALLQTSGGAMDAQGSATAPIYLNVEYLGA